MQLFKIGLTCIVSIMIAFFLIADPFNFQFGTRYVYFYSSIPFGWYALNRLLDKYYRPPDTFMSIEAAIMIRVIKSFLKFVISMMVGFIVTPFVLLYGIYLIYSKIALIRPKTKYEQSKDADNV